MNDAVWVIIPAGGQGVRARSPVPKQLQEIGGKTVLERTVSRLARVSGVTGIVVALPAPPSDPDTQTLMEQVKRRLHAVSDSGVQLVFVPGGNTRQESVYNALRAVPDGTRWVAVHDASRPFCTGALFERVREAARKHGAAICAVTPPDTVKSIRIEADESWVQATLERDSLASVQTPQVFAAEVLRLAHEAARRDGVMGTDDSQLVERLGHEVAVVEGERSNLKLTHPEDLALAKVLLGEEPAGGIPAVGLGFDVHRLVPRRKCVIGGVDIPFEKGLLGHSDADVLCHAVMDAVLGALGKNDIGQWFPDDDPRYEGVSSIGLMTDMWNALKSDAKILNVDAVVIAESPKIMPHSQQMRANIAGALRCEVGRVSIKATTAERLGTIGRGEGIAAFCVVTVRRLKEGPG